RPADWKRSNKARVVCGPTPATIVSRIRSSRASSGFDSAKPSSLQQSSVVSKYQYGEGESAVRVLVFTDHRPLLKSQHGPHVDFTGGGGQLDRADRARQAD